MQTIISLERQTLFDIAIRHCGDVEAVFEIMQLNNLSVTDELQSGQSITVPDSYARKITDFYQANNIQPATAYISTVAISGNGITTNDNSNDLITNDNNDLIIENNG